MGAGSGRSEGSPHERSYEIAENLAVSRRSGDSTANGNDGCYFEQRSGEDDQEVTEHVVVPELPVAELIAQCVSAVADPAAEVDSVRQDSTCSWCRAFARLRRLHARHSEFVYSCP